MSEENVINGIPTKDLFKAVMPEGKSIVEIGCGEGLHAEFLAPFSTDYLAIDINSEAISLAEDKYKEIDNLRFLISDITEETTHSDLYQVALMIMSFHEVDRLRQYAMLEKLVELLEPEGEILIIDPTNPSSEYQNVCDFIHKEYLGFDHKEAVRYSKSIVSEFLSIHSDFDVKQYEVEVPFEYDSLSSLVDEIVCDFRYEVDFSDELKTLHDQLVTLINKDPTNPFVLFDKIEFCRIMCY